MDKFMLSKGDYFMLNIEVSRPKIEEVELINEFFQIVLRDTFRKNDILDLVNVFIPPMMSSTMNADALGSIQQQKKDTGSVDGNGAPKQPGQSDGAGRKELDNDQKSEKTIANRESMN